MAELAFRDGIMDQIRLRERRFHEHAYLFVLAALEFCQSRLTERRHIGGASSPPRAGILHSTGTGCSPDTFSIIGGFVRPPTLAILSSRSSI